MAPNVFNQKLYNYFKFPIAKFKFYFVQNLRIFHNLANFFRADFASETAQFGQKKSGQEGGPDVLQTKIVQVTRVFKGYINSTLTKICEFFIIWPIFHYRRI